MVASCPTAAPVDVHRLARGLDAVLPEDVGVRAVAVVPAGFHARRDAAWKWYRYAVLTTPGRRPLLRRHVWHLRGGLDPERLEAGAAATVGRRDFASFSASGSPRRTTERTLYAVGWTCDDECLFLDVVGDGFLYKMVRTMAGTMVREARAGGSPEAVTARMGEILTARDRRAAGPSAPARGLCLMAVGMAGEDPAGRLPPNLAAAVESAPRTSLGGRS
jgi:tRNA pseudouridine38-40 synthase